MHGNNINWAEQIVMPVMWHSKLNLEGQTVEISGRSVTCQTHECFIGNLFFPRNANKNIKDFLDKLLKQGLIEEV